MYFQSFLPPPPLISGSSTFISQNISDDIKVSKVKLAQQHLARKEANQLRLRELAGRQPVWRDTALHGVTWLCME